MHIALLNAEKNNRIIRINHNNIENQVIFFYQHTKKDQNIPSKNFHIDNSSKKPLPDSYNNYRQPSLYGNKFHGRSPDRRKSQKFSQNRYSRSNSYNNRYRNKYLRSNSNRSSYSNCNQNCFFSNSHYRYYSNDSSKN